MFIGILFLTASISYSQVTTNVGSKSDGNHEAHEKCKRLSGKAYQMCIMLQVNGDGEIITNPSNTPTKGMGLVSRTTKPGLVILDKMKKIISKFIDND